MSKVYFSILFFIAGVLLGCFYGADTLSVSKAGPDRPPAYLLAGWNVTKPKELGPFSELVVPLAEKSGFEMVAANPPKLLEGEWPYTGIVIFQRYDSLAALERFWHSEEHEEIKKLLE